MCDYPRFFPPSSPRLDIAPGFYRNHDEDLKVLGTSSIESLFTNLKMNNIGTRAESTLTREHPNCLEGDNYSDKIEKVGLERLQL